MSHLSAKYVNIIATSTVCSVKLWFIDFTDKSAKIV